MDESPVFHIKTKLGEYLIPKNLLYTKDDEWIKVEGEVLTLGITDYAQKKLKYIVSVELPEVGRRVSSGDAVASLESVKAVAEVYTPTSGEVIEVNEELVDKPDLINKDPYGKGWLIKIRAPGLDRSKVLSAEDYAGKILKEESS
ncbi:MAG: glycine cleavage system protein GcvH [Zestosphaera sp.]